ncbi:protein FAM204A isoform X2 [Heptranchias perlo]|uniref:protein FAM204A isoform X2 n=1 Tax=Heptranchias perlo TaxID=212740 RepID=UPI00355A43D8
MADSTDQKPNRMSPGQSSNENKSDTGWKEKKAGEDSKDVTEECPAGVSLQLWKKFQELKERRNSITKTSFKKRVRQKRKAVDADYSYTEGSTNVGTNGEESSIKIQKSEQEQKTENKSELTMREAHWSELKQYFGANDRFEFPACNIPPSKTNLEKNLDKAIATGAIDEAEQMSDSLAIRELPILVSSHSDLCHWEGGGKILPQGERKIVEQKLIAKFRTHEDGLNRDLGFMSRYTLPHQRTNVICF